MSSYILTSKQKLKKWILLFLGLPIIYIFTIFSFNIIIDPYDITMYNLLNIQHKLTRNDRVDKVQAVKKFKTLDTVIFGSSRTYTINPDSFKKYFRGMNNYNFGIGGSQMEDNLGALLYLKRINKLPKNILLAIDFNSFNPNIPTNPYFLRSKDLNFLEKIDDNGYELTKYFTMDATRASFTTLKHHIKGDKVHQRFNTKGLSFVSDSSVNNSISLEQDIKKIFQNFLKNGNYPSLDKNRIIYFERFLNICKINNINLIIYSSPTYIANYKDIINHPVLSKRLIEFNHYFNQYNNFNNQFYDSNFSKNSYNFSDRVHITTPAGDRLLNIVLNKK